MTKVLNQHYTITIAYHTIIIIVHHHTSAIIYPDSFWSWKPTNAYNTPLHTVSNNYYTLCCNTLGHTPIVGVRNEVTTNHYESTMVITILVVVSTPLKNMKVKWDDSCKLNGK